MSHAIEFPLPVAPVTEFITAPGHGEAFNDIAQAMETGAGGQVGWSDLVMQTSDGWMVTDAGQRWLESSGNHGLAYREAQVTGRVATCPVWCTANHPRQQLALGHVMHKAHEVEGGFGHVGIYGVDLDGPVHGPEIDLSMASPHDWSAADLREAAAAFLAVADAFERVTTS